MVATSDGVDVDYTRLGRDVRCQRKYGIKVGDVGDAGDVDLFIVLLGVSVACSAHLCL